MTDNIRANWEFKEKRQVWIYLQQE